MRGSLLFSEDGQELTFVGTGGALPPDVYTVRIRSAADGFKDLAGGLLDGNGDVYRGDDYVASFAVDPPAADEVVVSVADVVRGAGQRLDGPAGTPAGLPVILSTGLNVSSVDFELAYDPALLTVTGFATDVAGASAAYTSRSPACSA